MDTEKTDRALLAAGLRTFFQLAEEWQLSGAEQGSLLGSPDIATLRGWRRGAIASATADTLKRISYLLGIYQAIRTLLPDPARANGWMRAPNFAPLFGGRSALDVMIDGDIANLRGVRAYLDAQLE